VSQYSLSAALPAYIEAMAGERLAAARIAALFNVARPAYYATVANAAILIAVLWGAMPSTLLLAWFGILTALTLGRLWLHRRYMRGAMGPASSSGAERWESQFALGALAAGALWTFPPAVFFPQSEPLLQMAVIFVVGGNIIGAAGVYAPSPAAFYGFSALPLAAVIVQLALQPGRTYQLLALMVLVFAVVMVRVYHDIHRSIVRTLRTQIENDELMARLAQSESQLRDAIQSFPEGIAIYDTGDRLVVCNEAYARVYGAGRGAAELAGTPYAEIARNAFDAEIVAPEYSGRRAEWIEERLARRAGGAGPVRYYQTRDGRSMQGLFVRSRNGGVVSAFIDVTDLRGAQDALGMVLEEETLLLDTLPVGVAFLSGGLIVRCNRRLEQMLGYGPGELNRKAARALHGEERFWQADRELAITTRQGGELWCRISSRDVDGGGSTQSWAIVAFSDISEAHDSALALQKSEALFRNLVETSNDLVWSIDAAGRWTYLSPAAARRIYGYRPVDLFGRELRQVTAPELRERDLAVFRRVLDGETVFDFETRHVRGDGSPVDLSFNAVPLRDAAGVVAGATGTARDITRDKAAAAALYESVEKLRLAVEAADLAYWEWDRETGSMHFGRAPQPGANTPRMPFADYLLRVHEDDRERVREASLATQRQGDPYELEFRVVDGDGRVHWMHSRGKAIADRGGQVHRVIGVSQDITERKRREDEARFLAHHDTLTGLPNRRLLDDRLTQALFLAQRRDKGVAVMLIDLDRFKQVNDELGHRAGDTVLREAAHRLAACVRKADTVARHGGDEFVVVIPDLQSAAECQVVAEKILRALEAPFAVDGREFSIGASIGITLFPGDAGDGESLLRNADVAMYRAKQREGNNFRFYAR
jgi:diguanylate cyclase (GGDEF)-like protein/PAS domain S-box-containing protein